jgi:hypothetical protein
MLFLSCFVLCGIACWPSSCFGSLQEVFCNVNCLFLTRQGVFLLGMLNGAPHGDPLRSPTSRLAPSPITQPPIPSFVLQEGTTPLNGEAST